MICLIVLVTLFAVGCNKGPEMVQVEGTVIYNGKSLKYGSVMFQPVGVEGAQTARSDIGPNGEFALSTDKDGDGVVVGSSKVRITAFEAQRADATGNKHEEMALGKSAVPRRFQNFATSGIVVEVTPDMQLPIEINLDETK